MPDAEVPDTAAADGDDGGEEPRVVLPPGDEPPLDPTYLQLFLLKYVCAQPGCFGTLAPLPPAAADGMMSCGEAAGVHECNVCGALRSEAEFLQELEQGR
jgi:hypothetical protein